MSGCFRSSTMAHHLMASVEKMMARWVKRMLRKPKTVCLFAGGEHPIQDHPNAVPFSGCLALLNTPSDKSPSGALGHRVLLTEAVAKRALPSLIGMAINYKSGMSGHNPRQKCGIITRAKIDGDKLMVRGIIYASDFPDLIQKLSEGKFGMSYEMKDAHIADMRASVWRIDNLTFMGAAVILHERAAYRSSEFSLNVDVRP